MKIFKLTEEDLKQEVSDSHVEKLSEYCHWRRLPSHLDMKTTVVEDIDRNRLLIDESEKRHNFFKKWKQAKGQTATYKALVIALLEINFRQDAESVCKLLQTPTSAHPSPPSSDASVNADVATGTCMHCYQYLAL